MSDMERVDKEVKRAIESGGPLQLKEHFDLIDSESIEDQIKAVRHFRRILSIENNPPIDKVLELDVIPKFVHFLQQKNSIDLRFESAWALTNIASGTTLHCKKVVDGGAVSILVDILNDKESDTNLVEQVIWCLGNISGDCVDNRDFCIRSGAIQSLIQVSETYLNTKEKVIRQAAWTLSNLMRGKPKPDFELVKTAFPTLVSFMSSKDSQTRTDACWAFSYLSDGLNEHIEAVIASGVVPTIFELANQDLRSDIVCPAVRTLGNIVTGDERQTQFILDLNILPMLMNLMSHPKKNIVKESVWMLSNITAGTASQIEAVIRCPGLIQKVIELLESSDHNIQKEACWVISNATSGGNESHLLTSLVSSIEPMCKLLHSHDQKTVAVVLEGLENFLRTDSYAVSPVGVVSKIMSCQGLDTIKELMVGPSNTSRRAERLVSTYFQNEKVSEATSNPYQGIDVSDCPCEYLCPISYEIMNDPVKLGDTNHIFNRRSINYWLRGHNTDPLTNLPLKNRSLVSDIDLKNEIDRYVLSLSLESVDSDDSISQGSAPIESNSL